MQKIILATCLSLLFVIGVHAQTEGNPLTAKFLIEGGIEYGGDELLTIFFTNGGDQTMLAGQGGYLAIGGQLEFSAVKSLMLRATMGIKYNTTAADDANIRLTRFPLTFIPFLKINEDFRLGAGITSHGRVRFNGDGFVNDVSFTSSVGPRIELGYKWIAVTYTSLNYTADTDDVLSASSFGVVASFTLP